MAHKISESAHVKINTLRIRIDFGLHWKFGLGLVNNKNILVGTWTRIKRRTLTPREISSTSIM